MQEQSTISGRSTDCRKSNEVRIEEFLRAPPRVIGQDNWHLLVSDRMRRGSITQPAASRTLLGWVLHGTHTRSLGRRVHYVHHVAEHNIEEIVRRYFHIYSLGVQPRQLRSDPEKKGAENTRRKYYGTVIRRIRNETTVEIE
ncbi:hypothetical protein EVAR_62565_1 [Eumeta japonica]|uniref:Uncharacterized protein n=1 Tax=Eumeta variegata TaxID=151549 RepID=A0A4C1YS54_EUMVA|nr:hypothetical protein EVAR_62565_1 [Eumeta japonica]